VGIFRFEIPDIGGINRYEYERRTAYGMDKGGEKFQHFFTCRLRDFRLGIYVSWSVLIIHFSDYDNLFS
jgi:hypothetical protein